MFRMLSSFYARRDNPTTYFKIFLIYYYHIPNCSWVNVLTFYIVLISLSFQPELLYHRIITKYMRSGELFTKTVRVRRYVLCSLYITM